MYVVGYIRSGVELGTVYEFENWGDAVNEISETVYNLTTVKTGFEYWDSNLTLAVGDYVFFLGAVG